MTRTDLSEKMHALAEAGHRRHAELRAAADAFDAATTGFFASTPTHTPQQQLGAWAKANRIYSECSGKVAGRKW